MNRATAIMCEYLYHFVALAHLNSDKVLTESIADINRNKAVGNLTEPEQQLLTAAVALLESHRDT